MHRGPEAGPMSQQRVLFSKPWNHLVCDSEQRLGVTFRINPKSKKREARQEENQNSFIFSRQLNFKKAFSKNLPRKAIQINVKRFS